MTNFTPRCYIAGPMTGYPEHNYPAFHKAAAEMRALGWEVINPAENHGGNQALPREDYFRTDIPQLVTCDAVLFLDGWRKSKGAKLEFKVAKACGVRAMSLQHAPSRALIGGWFELDMDHFYPPLDSWPREEREKAEALDERFRQPHVFDGFSLKPVAQPDPFSALLDQIRTLHDKKKADYTGGEHPLANYANSGESIGVSAVASMFSRMNEKVFRLKQLHKTGAAPQNESVIDSYMDVAILSLLSILALTPGSGYEQEAA